MRGSPGGPVQRSRRVRWGITRSHVIPRAEDGGEWMRQYRIPFVAAATVAVALAIGLSAAYATRTVRLASHISIESTAAGIFSGKVTSSNAACDSGRKVTLYTTTGLKLG